VSLNLHCNKIELHQTPTHITKMCLQTDDVILSQATGKAAVRALRCYILWVASLSDGVFDTAKAAESVRKTMTSHIKEVEIVLTDPDLKVYLM